MMVMYQMMTLMIHLQYWSSGTLLIILQQLYQILIILQVKVLVTFVIDFITTQTHYYDDHYDNG